MHSKVIRHSHGRVPDFFNLKTTVVWGIMIIKVSLRGDYGTMLIFTSDMTLDLRCYTYVTIHSCFNVYSGTTTYIYTAVRVWYVMARFVNESCPIGRNHYKSWLRHDGSSLPSSRGSRACTGCAYAYFGLNLTDMTPCSGKHNLTSVHMYVIMPHLPNRLWIVTLAL